MLLGCIGWRKQNREDRILSYASAFETTVRRYRLLFAGILTRTGEERLSTKVMLGEMVRGISYPGGQEWDWMTYLEKDPRSLASSSNGGVRRPRKLAYGSDG